MDTHTHTHIIHFRFVEQTEPVGQMRIGQRINMRTQNHQRMRMGCVGQMRTRPHFVIFAFGLGFERFESIDLRRMANQCMR